MAFSSNKQLNAYILPTIPLFCICLPRSLCPFDFIALRVPIHSSGFTDLPFLPHFLRKPFNSSVAKCDRKLAHYLHVPTGSNNSLFLEQTPSHVYGSGHEKNVLKSETRADSLQIECGCLVGDSRWSGEHNCLQRNSLNWSLPGIKNASSRNSWAGPIGRI